VRFGLIHRILINALAALGLMALLTGGQVQPLVAILVSVGMLLAMLMPERLQGGRLLNQAGGVASVLLLCGQAVRALGGVEFLPLAVEFVAALQVIRVATRRGAAHDQQIILLSLLHLVAGSVLGAGLAYALSFAGFLLVAPGALVLSHLRREVEGNYRQGARDRTGHPVDVPRILRSRRVVSRQFVWMTCSLSLPVFVFTALLFVLFPRVGLSLLLINPPRASRMVGFSDRVDLGGVGRLRADPTVALLVRIRDLPSPPPARLALYLRGAAFDKYENGSWMRTRTGQTAVDSRGTIWVTRPTLSSVWMNLELEPISPPVLFMPTDAVGFRLDEPVEQPLGHPIQIMEGADGEFQYQSVEERGLKYTVLHGSATPEALSPPDRDRYLEVPTELRQSLAELAQSWTGNATVDTQIASAFEHHLRTEYRYDLDSPSTAAPQPLLHFLFESKSGHCEFYSTALALLLRTAGVPTRNVTGFVGGTYNRFGDFYTVRQGDAHSWIEAYLNGRGWTRFDPTPPVEMESDGRFDGAFSVMRDVLEATSRRWRRYVVGYDLDQQLSLLDQVRQRGRQLGLGRTSWSSWAARIGAVALVAAQLVYAWRRGWLKRVGKATRAQRREAHDSRASALYAKLEDALRVLGISRELSTPPLAHALALTELNHPSAAEILALTQTYLEGRFGGRTLSPEDERDFEGRVIRLRSPQNRPPVQTA
jgi:protein-glutamine gamma-glutamyltransferase